MDKSFRREETLTSEALSKRFGKSTFELVNYAIKLAGEMIASGHAPVPESDEDLNIANAVLHEIAEGRDRLEPVIITEEAYLNSNGNISLYAKVEEQP